MKIAIGLYVLLSLVAIAVLAYFLYDCKNKEKFCGACQGMDGMTYPDRELIRKLYNEGKLTEYSPMNQHPKWKKNSWDCFLAGQAMGDGTPPANRCS